jgi:hypothetical protein
VAVVAGRADLPVLYPCQVAGPLVGMRLSSSGRVVLVLFEVGCEFGSERSQCCAVLSGEPGEEGGFGCEQVGVGLVGDRVASGGQLDQED